MNRVSTLAAAAAVAALMAVSSPASATILTATYTGFINDGFDMTGLFGTAGQNLATLGYVARYTYDTNAGFHDTSNPAIDIIEGGSFYGAAAPVSATLTINGVTLSVGGGYKSFALTAPGAPDIEHQNATGPSSNPAYEELTNFAFVTLPTITSTLATTGSLVQGDFVFAVANANLTAFTTHTFGHFNGQGTVTISDGSVPEPATWGLMILGFGGAGVALRRRRTTAATA
jgi:hypothetical protein